MTEIHLSHNQYLELEKIAIGAFAPLNGFMVEDEFRTVVRNMRLPNGQPFPLPVTLDLTKDEAHRLRGLSSVSLVFRDIEVGALEPNSIFTCDKKDTAQAVFGSLEGAHPGVAYFMRSEDWFVGGPVKLHKRIPLEFAELELEPAETRAIFKERGWKTVTGFQTRNVPHRAHEHLQRLSLEITDGLFIQPLVGRKKPGDYSPEAVLNGYRRLIEEFYPPQNVLLGILTTWMRYAGPREAVFHAIVRRNYGCTHFVVGRDHAGVGNYYGLYDAHELTKKF